MKSLINPTPYYIIILLIIATTISCNQNTVPELDTYKKKIEEQNETIKKLTSQLNNRNYRTPSNIISADFAKEIYHQYDKREKLINEYISTDGNGKKFNATRSLFYDINSLKDYIRYIENLSKKANVNPTGINFYFAQYPNNYKRAGDKKYAKRQTIFLAPTLQKEVNGEVQNLGYTLDKNLKVVLLKNKLDFTSSNIKNYQKASLLNFNTSINDIENSLLANEMGSSPPIGRE